MDNEIDILIDFQIINTEYITQRSNEVIKEIINESYMNVWVGKSETMCNLRVTELENFENTIRQLDEGEHMVCRHITFCYSVSFIYSVSGHNG